MNAQEQHSHYKARRRELSDLLAESRRDGMHPAFDPRRDDARGWQIMVEIMAKLDAAIERYGDRAFPLSEKQVALIERVLNSVEAAIMAERERIGLNVQAEPIEEVRPYGVPAAIVDHDNAVIAEAAAMGISIARVDGDWSDWRGYWVEDVIDGKLARFEARQKIAEIQAQIDGDDARRALDTSPERDGYRRRTMPADQTARELGEGTPLEIACPALFRGIA